MLRNNNDIYSWDSKNRLISITKPDLKTIYTYDFEGNRTSKIVSDNTGEKTQTLYISKDFEIRNHQAIRYIFVGNKRLARIDSQTQYQTLFFAKGWNFFSLTIEPENCEILSVLKPVQNYFTEIWEYDSKKQMYKGYVPEKGIHQLTELHANKGYIIHMKDAASIQFCGKQASHKINLSAGWNLTGSLSAQQINIRDMNNENKAHIQSIWSYDTVNDKWNTFVVNHPVFLNELQEITPGKAYWVEMKNDAVIHDNQQPTNIYYYHSDHLGSTNVITKSDGSVVKRIEFYPYGKIRFESNDNFDSEYTYTGKEMDQESGLIYFGARYYDPSAGRFISVDPLYVEADSLEKKKWNQFLINPQLDNIYTYALNNSMRYIDLNGLENNDFSTGQLVENIIQNKESVGLMMSMTGEGILNFYKQAPGFVIICPEGPLVGASLFVLGNLLSYVPDELYDIGVDTISYKYVDYNRTNLNPLAGFVMETSEIDKTIEKCKNDITYMNKQYNSNPFFTLSEAFGMKVSDSMKYSIYFK
jgi:RHS repeat-associated protein